MRDIVKSRSGGRSRGRSRSRRLRLLRAVAIALSMQVALFGCARIPTAPPLTPWPYGAMVSAANPYAADAAVSILRAGGSAVDAAIAAHAVLGLVEPQSSGLGGGAFMLVYQRDGGVVTAYDGRETAPAGARPEMFMIDGRPHGFRDAWQSGLSVGTPGIVALYAETHARHGRLSLAQVLTPAIELARDGFVVSPRLADFLERLRPVIRLDENPDTSEYFYPGGVALAAGDRRDNSDYADTLEDFVTRGTASFYQGELAEEIVAAVGAEPLPGSLALQDLAGYQISKQDALCGYAEDVRLCTMPPPSSGLAQLMILNLYDRLLTSDDDPGQRWSALVDAQRLTYADRDRYVADPRYVEVPVADLVDPDYLDVRARQRAAPGDTAGPGDPGAILRDSPMLGSRGPDSTLPLPSTTHLSIVDAQGNAVSMTATVESVFGSSRWAGGFLLNNQLTDFARDPGTADAPAVNRVEPGKRPRSSMSPTMVFDAATNELMMVTGSPGGNSIVAYVAKTLVGVLRWNLSAQQAVDLPNVIARGANVRVETGVDKGSVVAALLKDRGYPVEEREGENSGLHVIVVSDAGLEGAADPRREGRVRWVSPD